MNVEQLKTAIEAINVEKQCVNRATNCNRECGSCDLVLRAETILNAYDTALQVLQSELDRQENKALTLDELKEMVGEPVWDDFDDEWRILEDVDYIDELESEICFTDSFQVVYHDCRFYKHKPNDGIK